MVNIQNVRDVKGGVYQNCSVNINQGVLDSLHTMMQESRFEEAMAYMQSLHRFCGTYHPQYPLFTVGYKEMFGDTIPYSKPVYTEALTVLPPTIQGKFTIKEVPPGCTSMCDILSYAYRTQSEIEINIIELKKMLGDFEDPLQDEVEKIKSITDGKWFLKTEEFPPARPCRLVIEGGEASINYLNLRVKKILDNDVVILVNENGAGLDLEVEMDLLKHEMIIRFNVDTKNAKSKRISVEYFKFLIESAGKKNISIYLLEDGSKLATGYLNSIDAIDHLEKIRFSLDLLERLLVIEEKYGGCIHIPEEVSNSEYENIVMLSNLIKKGTSKGRWTEVSLQLELTDESIPRIRSIPNASLLFVFDYSFSADIFGYLVGPVYIKKELKNAVVSNFEGIIRKIEVLEPGDLLSMKLVPGENAECIDTLIDDQVFEYLG